MWLLLQECQRLMVDNRSLKSNLGQGASQTHPSGTDSPSQMSQLQKQVQLLTAQLNKVHHYTLGSLNYLVIMYHHYHYHQS